MSRYGRYGGETKVYVGNLGMGAGKGELERAFGYYGPLRTVWIARNPPGFAFVEFEDPRDADDAVRGLDGKVVCGSRVRVELSTGTPRRSRYDRPPTRRPFDPNDKCYECGEKGHYAYDCHRYGRRSRRSRQVETVGVCMRASTCLDGANWPITTCPGLAPGPMGGVTLAAGAEGGGPGLSVLVAPTQSLPEDPDLPHLGGPGPDQGPGAGPSPGPGRVLEAGAGLDPWVSLALDLQLELARPQGVLLQTDDQLNVFLFFCL
ncbi:RNA-binding motif protein, X chromosome-like isoform X1 [Seriola aureovittata]|uniref:RNA-binding motif protein, X chromosome-like isoform X1 n=1 Tax=Seriola aureovittata TaxID=2871759 RepID=UPI0024BF0CB0|nr:RNA-binding motif protein, X chromosome-like isoform X1 [Seriola aureovittata]